MELSVRDLAFAVVRAKTTGNLTDQQVRNVVANALRLASEEVAR